MNIFDSTGLTDGATDEITVASSSKSIEVMNMSHLALDVTGDTQGLMFTLQPFQSKAKVVNSGQTVQFKLHQPITQAIQNPNEYVQVNQSTEPTESAVQALAFVPVYTDNVQLTGTNTVDIATGATVGINGTPTVQFAAGQNVGINGTANVQFPTAQQVTLASNAGVIIEGSNVTQDANIINQTVTTNPTVIGMPTDFSVTNLAAGASVNFDVPISEAMYDTLFFRFHSSNGEMNNYQFSMLLVWLKSYGLVTLNTNESITLAAQNASIGFTYPEVIIPPTIFDTARITVKNTGTTTIANDTLTIQAYGKYATQTSQLNSQTQTTPFNIPSQSIPANTNTAPIYTTPIPATNIKKASVQIQQTAATGLEGSEYSGGAVALVAQLQVSNDGVNFGTPNGYDETVSQQVQAGETFISHPFGFLASYSNGANNVDTDSSTVFNTTPAGIPAMSSGYPYIRFAIFIWVGGGISGNWTASASGNLIVNYLE